MFASILSSILFCVVLIGSIAHAKPVSSDSCKVAGIIRRGSCSFGLHTSPKCNSSTLDLTGSNFSKPCNSVDIFWSYPMNNLTMIIETPFTQENQSYSIELQRKQLNTQISHIYQVSENGVPTELQPKGDIITVQSNANYQVILRFQAPTKLILFGTFIKYDVVKN